MTEIEVDESPTPPADEAPRKAPKKDRGMVGAADPGRGGLRAAPAQEGTAFVRTANEADYIWNQICEWLPKSNDPAMPTRSPYDVMISVRRSWPPHASGLAQPVGQGFPGSAVAGGEGRLPGDALINFVAKYMHLPLTDQPATYDLTFFKKSTGAVITSGRLPMPSGPECRAALAAAERAAVETNGLGSPPASTLPEPRRPAPEPPWAQQAQQAQPQQPWNIQPAVYAMGGAPPWGYPYAPPTPAGPVGIDAATMGELSYLRGALSEALAAAREGRAPMIAPPPIPTPVVAGPPRLSDDELIERVAARVLAGLKGTPAQAAPPAPNPTALGVNGMFEKAVGTLFETSLHAVVAGVQKSIKNGMGMGSPAGGTAYDDGPDEPPAAPEPPPNPQDAVPWTVAPVGSNWGNGQPVQIALDKETGNLSPMGLAFANPVVAERAMGVIENLGNAITDAIKKFNAQPLAQRAPGIPAPPLPPGPPAPPQVAAAPSGWGAPPSPPTPPAPPAPPSPPSP